MSVAYKSQWKESQAETKVSHSERKDEDAASCCPKAWSSGNKENNKAVP